MKKTLSLSQLVEKLSEHNENATLLSENQDQIKIENYISTGNYILNAQLTGDIYKGVPEGKIVVLSGESSTGKTFLGCNIVKNAIADGYSVFWFDSENAFDELLAERFSFDYSKVVYLPVGQISEVTTYLVNLCKLLKETKSSDKILVVIDSLGNLSTDKEKADSISGSQKADMTRAKEIKRLFRVCTTDLGILKIPSLIMNHTYADTTSFIPQNIQSGGSGIKYNSSFTVQFRKKKLKEKDGHQTGVVITSVIEKSRFTKGGIPVSFHISFYGGMNPYVGLHAYLDYETIGVGPGRLTEETVSELVDPEKKKTRQVKTGKLIYEKDDSANPKFFAVAHLRRHVAPNELFTPEIFTPEVLGRLNEKLGKIFKFPDKASVDLTEIPIEESDDE